MLISNNLKYYNTSKRKIAKKLSFLNIFLKKKKKEMFGIRKKISYYIYPVISNYYNNLFFYKYIEKMCGYIFLKKIKFKNFKKVKNWKKYKNKKYLIFFIFIFSGFVLFFLVISFLFKRYKTRQKVSFILLLNKKFFSISIFYSLLKNYYIHFFNYSKNWQNLLISYHFDLQKKLTFVNNFNLKAFFSLNIFMLLLNIEEFKYNSDEYYINFLKLKKKREVSFKFLYLDIWKKNCISFFSFCIFELYMYIHYNSFLNFLNFEFFDYWIEFKRENSFFYEKVSGDALQSKFKDLQLKNKKENLIVDHLNLDYNFINLNDFNLRIKYNIFIIWYNYIVFFKKMRYYLYIRNNVYFYNNFSKKQFFLNYNNPVDFNKTKIIMSKCDRILKEQYYGFITLKDFNDGYSFYKINDYKSLLKFNDNNDIEHFFVFNKIFQNNNIKFMINFLTSKYIRTIFRKFWKNNLLKFYFTDNVLSCYKLLMQVKSVNKYRQATYAYETLHQMVKVVFSLPMEVMQYLDFKNKKIMNSILGYFFKKEFIPFHFFRDFFNYKNVSYFYQNINLLKYTHKLSNLALYYFNPKFFYKLLNKKKVSSSILFNYKKNYKKKVSTNFWKRKYRFSQILYNLHTLKKKKKNKYLNIVDYEYIVKNFFGEWRSVRMLSNILSLKKFKYFKQIDLRLFYLLWNYNTGFCSLKYHNFDNYNLVFGLNVFQFLKKTRFLNFINKFNGYFKMSGTSYYPIIKFLPLLKNFYFQLLFEDKEYILLMFFLLIKDHIIFINNSKIALNIKSFFFNDLLYRDYTRRIMFDSCYFDNMFNNFIKFKENQYDPILTPFIYRNYYDYYEHLSFYSLNIENNFIYKKNEISI